MPKILIVDDEQKIREVIREYSEFNGYEVEEAADGMEAVSLCRLNDYDLIIMDIMMPRLDGYSACKEIKKAKNIPVIMLSARGEEYDKLFGFELGIDDYVVKPFSPKELMARVKAVLRRYTKSDESSEKFVFGDIEADFENHSVICAGEKIELTLKEFELLEVLVKNRGKILTRQMLLDKIWGYEYIGESRTVDVHIRYLRKKVEKDDKNPKFIETIRGVGYRFNPHV